MADYKELEKLVARIQQQLAPKSEVIHNTTLWVVVRSACVKSMFW
jgi:hypothetical protein